MLMISTFILIYFPIAKHKAIEFDNVVHQYLKKLCTCKHGSSIFECEKESKPAEHLHVIYHIPSLYNVKCSSQIHTKSS